MSTKYIPKRHHHKALFISDVHIGSNYSRIENLLAFLKCHSASTIYLVGDILDDHFDRGFNWDVANQVFSEILTWSNNLNSKIIFTPGNHDVRFSKFYGRYGDLIVCDSDVYISDNGIRYFVTHGHQLDWVYVNMPYITNIASWTDRLIRKLNHSANNQDFISLQLNSTINRLLMSKWFDFKLKSIVENADCEGIICGHFHNAVITNRAGIPYVNCGDWVDGCTAVVDDSYGMRILRYGKEYM